MRHETKKNMGTRFVLRFWLKASLGPVCLASTQKYQRLCTMSTTVSPQRRLPFSPLSSLPTPFQAIVSRYMAPLRSLSPTWRFFSDPNAPPLKNRKEYLPRSTRRTWWKTKKYSVKKAPRAFLPFLPHPTPFYFFTKHHIFPLQKTIQLVLSTPGASTGDSTESLAPQRRLFLQRAFFRAFQTSVKRHASTHCRFDRS